MNKYRLFVDDLRSCPEGWILARTVTEAIRFLATFPIHEVSLDHDIACRLVTGHEHSSNETFEPVARYLASRRREYKSLNMPWLLKVRIHTANFEAGQLMAEIIGIPYAPYIYRESDHAIPKKGSRSKGAPVS